MKMRTALIGGLAALLPLSACAASPNSDVALSPSPEPCAHAELTETDRDRLLRRIDYALLGQLASVADTLQNYAVLDADNDGVEEFFCNCLLPTVSKEALYVCDFTPDGTPQTAYLANRSTSGSSRIWMDSAHQVPVLCTSFSSLASCNSDSYSFWNGSQWEGFAGFSQRIDFAASDDADTPVYIESANYESEDISPEEFQRRIDALKLAPLSEDWNGLFTVEWPSTELGEFADLYNAHLAELGALGSYDHQITGDFDGDETDEIIWFLSGATAPWNTHMVGTPGFDEIEVEGYHIFSPQGALLVLADPSPRGITIHTGLFSDCTLSEVSRQGGLFHLTNEPQLTCQFRCTGTEKETGKILLEEVIPKDFSLLRNGYWYQFLSQATLVDVYCFHNFGRGSILRYNTDTGERLESDTRSFTYSVSPGCKTVTITTSDDYTTVYSCFPDSAYGPVLADMIYTSFMPDGSECTYQSLIWYYDSFLSAPHLKAEQLARTNLRVPEAGYASTDEPKLEASSLTLPQYLGKTFGELQEYFVSSYTTDWYGGGQYFCFDGTDVMCFIDEYDTSGSDWPSDDAVVVSAIGDGYTYLYGYRPEGETGQLPLSELEAALGQTLSVSGEEYDGFYTAALTVDGVELHISLSEYNGAYYVFEILVKSNPWS